MLPSAGILGAYGMFGSAIVSHRSARGQQHHPPLKIRLRNSNKPPKNTAAAHTNSARSRFFSHNCRMCHVLRLLKVITRNANPRSTKNASPATFSCPRIGAIRLQATRSTTYSYRGRCLSQCRAFVLWNTRGRAPGSVTSAQVLCQWQISVFPSPDCQYTNWLGLTGSGQFGPSHLG